MEKLQVFIAKSVKELSKRYLKEGDGAEITDSTTKFQAYYIEAGNPMKQCSSSSFSNGAFKVSSCFKKDNNEWNAG